MTIVFGVQIPNTIYLTSSTKVDEGSNFACARSPNGFDEFDQVGTRDEWQSVVDVLCVCVYGMSLDQKGLVLATLLPMRDAVHY